MKSVAVSFSDIFLNGIWCDEECFRHVVPLNSGVMKNVIVSDVLHGTIM